MHYGKESPHRDRSTKKCAFTDNILSIIREQAICLYPSSVSPCDNPTFLCVAAINDGL